MQNLVEGRTWLASDRTLSVGAKIYDQHKRFLSEGVKLYHADGGFIMDFGRAELPRQMHPGEASRLRMRLQAPEQPGDYLLEFDMVKELEYWFGQRGAVPVRLPLQVLAPVAVG